MANKFYQMIQQCHGMQEHKQKSLVRMLSIVTHGKKRISETNQRNRNANQR